MSHHTAGVEMREHFALTPAEAEAWLAAERLAGRSAVLLSTCNRCEVYWTGEHNLDQWFQDFARARGADRLHAVTRLDGAAAIRHLYTVAAGLDSQILGESEILGQVRRAYQAARGAGTIDHLLDAVFVGALTTGRRVRRETMLGRHPASVSSAAVDVAASVTGGLTGRRALILGAGSVAEGLLQAIRPHRVAAVAVVNRHRTRAETLAASWGAVSAAWSDLEALLAATDIVFVSTSSTRPLLDADQLAEAVAAAPDRRLTVLDLSVPRNVQPSARAVAGLRLFDLDDLQQLRCPASGFAAPAIQEAERLLRREIERLLRALDAREAAPRLAELHRAAARLVEEESERALRELGDPSEQERRVVLSMAERLVRRVLYPVSRALRDESATETRRDSASINV
ncbi:MAG TPA: glutamyl-tRNA reductase [Gemmatimonadales bacterium]|nr:glutamyl-tRNA reductase [Gemmatimonadales bacterium]